MLLSFFKGEIKTPDEAIDPCGCLSSISRHFIYDLVVLATTNLWGFIFFWFWKL